MRLARRETIGFCSCAGVPKWPKGQDLSFGLSVELHAMTEIDILCVSRFESSNLFPRIQYLNLGMKLVDDSMAKPTGPTNAELNSLITELRKTKKDFFDDVADKLEMPRRKKSEVNVGALDSGAKKDEVIVVPSKVLGDGEITKPLKVYAWKFSAEAEQKITKAGGKCMPLKEILKSKENVKMVI